MSAPAARKKNVRKRDEAQIGKGKPGPGRPRGVPNKVTRALKEVAAEYGETAIAVLAALMNDAEQPGAVRVAAADKLLDRGFGRPAQTVELQENVVTADRARDLFATMQAAMVRYAEVRERRRSLGLAGD
jgi:hypothetical protein